MSEVVLQRPRVLAVVGELETTGVPEHVRVHAEPEPGFLAGPRQHLAEPGGAQGEPRSVIKT
jgi:hypothetical protein